MRGDVFAAFRRRQADFVKACDGDVGSTGEIEARVEIEAGRGEIKVGVEVAEDLAEIVHTGKQLVADSRRERGVPRSGVVGDVNRRDFVVVLDGGADGRDLISLADEIME